MLIQCPQCGTSFGTTRFGAQRCPNCGRDIFVEPPQQADPYAPPRMSEPTADEAVAPGETEPTPWERRAELGFFPALWQTIVAVMSQPTALFSRLDPEKTEGAFQYFALVTLIPAMVSGVYSWATSNPDQMNQVFSRMPPQQAQAMRAFLDLWHVYASPKGLVFMLGLAVATHVVGLFFFSGITHLMLMLTRGAHRPWSATYKTFCYAATPNALYLVPFCGPFVGWIWYVVLQCLGISKVQRISGGHGVAAVLVPFFLSICLLGCGAGVLMGIVIGNVG